MRFRRLSDKRLMLFTICFIGCVYQLTSVTYSYLNFMTRTEITFKYPTSVTIPEIDIAVPIANIINMSSLYEKYPEDMVDLCLYIHRDKNWTINSTQDFNEHCSTIGETTVLTNERLVATVTLGDVEELTEDPRKMIRGVYFDDYEINLMKANICLIHKYFNGIYVFLRISCREGSKPIDKQVLQTFSGNSYLLCIELFTDITFGFNFSPANSSLAARLRQYVIVDPKPDAGRFIYARWHRFVSSSLPWPYETQCENYDRSKTLVNCIDSRLLRSDKPAIFIDSIIPFGNYSPNLKFADDVLTGYDRKVLDKIFQDCQTLIERPECESVIYLTTFNEHTEATNGVEDNEGISLCLGTPLDTDTYYQTLPKFTLIEYLIYISSILGIWFGISIYGQLNSRHRHLHSLPNASDHIELDADKKWCKVSRMRNVKPKTLVETLKV